MKILIICKTDPANINFVEDCKSREDIFIYFIKNYLIDNTINDIEFVMEKCFINIKLNPDYKTTLTKHKYVDHIIFINDIGFKNTNITFIRYLRNIASTSILSLCNNYKYYCGENTLISFNKNIKEDKLLYIKPPLNSDLYSERKQKDHIFILLQKADNLHEAYYNELIMILNKIKILVNNNKNFSFTLGLINKKVIDYIDTDMTLLQTKIFESYIDYVYEISRANMFFIYFPIIDIYSMYEIAMCNTLIISKIGFIEKPICNELKIMTYNTDFNWSDIFKQMSIYKQHDILLSNNYSWENFMEKLINYLGNTQINIKSINQSYNSNKLKFYLNIKDRRNPNILNINNNQQLASSTLNKNKSTNSEIKPNKKAKRILLQ
ncbi:hypothetical protein QKU48_gp0687 [Fadolivirus algeromassiliense]|jgi:hypothetical protein|uniref:Uncharacterized protein n=1 Tax=Fadolivirus FV1/VV64 TaxID=3070911 RepID=A0A7D3QUH7_9VIRU|nr:hypothetical protein QKU48_gp0687 [Fadolivirus algeromassiliense]QKF94145.1 hypothetical protein Fadolivirus_1_687 [Fadolivirus FV1/VV64]